MPCTPYQQYGLLRGHELHLLRPYGSKKCEKTRLPQDTCRPPNRIADGEDMQGSRLNTIPMGRSQAWPPEAAAAAVVVVVAAAAVAVLVILFVVLMD